MHNNILYIYICVHDSNSVTSNTLYVIRIILYSVLYYTARRGNSVNDFQKGYFPTPFAISCPLYMHTDALFPPPPLPPYFLWIDSILCDFPSTHIIDVDVYI